MALSRQDNTRGEGRKRANAQSQGEASSPRREQRQSVGAAVSLRGWVDGSSPASVQAQASGGASVGCAMGSQGSVYPSCAVVSVVRSIP